MDGQASPAAYPTHQKNSTWDAFMWSNKLQLPSLEPLSPSLAPAGGAEAGFPSHRRGASMPPQLEEDPASTTSALPPIRYFDEARPRLGHRSRNTFSSLGTDSDWTLPPQPDDESVLVAEPPPTHRRGGSIPMVASGLGFGSDGLFASTMQSSSSSSSAGGMAHQQAYDHQSARPQHRRSVTFQGVTTRTSDMFDFDSLKLEASPPPRQQQQQQPLRMSTPPPPATPSPVIVAATQQQPSVSTPSRQQQASSHHPQQQQQTMHHHVLSHPQQQQSAMHLHIQQQQMHYAPHQQRSFHPQQQQQPSMIAVSPMLPQFASYPGATAAAAAAAAAGGTGTGYDDGRGDAPMDPALQLQLQMQQALFVQQQQWFLAMQQQMQHKMQQQQPPPPGPPQHSHHPQHSQQQHHQPRGSSSNYQQQGQHLSSPGPSGGGGKHSQPHSPSVPAGTKSLPGSDPVLSDYKSTGMRPRVEDLRGHVQAFAMDAHGSRFLQYQMEIARPEDKDMLVSESLHCAVGLMQDTFGNYVVQNFLEHAPSDSRRRLADMMKGSMLSLSIQPHGCRVVQRALDLVDIDQRNELLGELLVPKGNVFQAARNTHATHVLQKTVSILRRDSALEQAGEARLRGSIDLMRAMEKAIADDVIPLLLHPHAYRLVLNVLGDCDVQRSPFVAQAVDTIAANRDQLCVDQHGNFMLQHMLDNTQSESVLDYVQSRLVELSQHKFGSHLVEKCFAVASAERCLALVEELMRPTSESNLQATKKLLNGDSSGFASQSPALALMKDPYANFVVQKAFDRSQPGPLKQELIALVQDNAELLQKFTYGRHILAHVTSAAQPQQQQQRSGGSNSPVTVPSGSSSPVRSASGSPSGGPRNQHRGGGGGGGHHHRPQQQRGNNHHHSSTGGH